MHIPKGCICFAMAFSLVVEMLNMRMRSRRGKAPLELRNRPCADLPDGGEYRRRQSLSVMTLGRLLLILAFIAVAWWLWRDDTIHHGPGVVAPDAPRQETVDGVAPFDHAGYRITPLARFQLKARVLAREDYSLDREAELAPLDLALGWGPMSDETVLEQIDISQGGRWYRWFARRFPIPRRQIERHSANMHMIPADEVVADLLDDTRVGSIVSLRGYLVEARADDGWRWSSSLTRDDTGARSCELVFVERVSVYGAE